MIKKFRQIFAAALFFLLCCLVTGCDWLGEIDFTKATSLQIIHKSAILSLAWDPPISDIHGSPNQVASYNVYYRVHGEGDWVLLNEIPAHEHPECTIKHEDIGDGLFDFGVEAVTVSESISPMHSSLDNSADPICGWYVFWIKSE